MSSSSLTTIFANVSRPPVHNVASSSRTTLSTTLWSWSHPPPSGSTSNQTFTTQCSPPRSRPRNSPRPCPPRESIRCFSSSRSRLDHYRTLGVDRSTSMKDIKNQFYALSKKYHPDVNRDDEGAKKKFQEVSEAWSILGDEKNKREYDRQLRYGSGGSGSGSYSSGFAPRRYDGTDNTYRRARATYAWDYSRRKAESNRSKAGQHRYGSGAESRASSSSSSAGSPAQEQSRFEQHAARQRRRESFMNARANANATASAGGSGAGATATSAFDDGSAPEDHHGAGFSAMLRFTQMVLGLSIVGLTIFGISKRTSARSGRVHAEERQEPRTDGEEEFT